MTPKTVFEALILKEFENDENVDFWTEIRSLDLPVYIMVSPFGQDNFETILGKENIDYSVNVDDVET